MRGIKINPTNRTIGEVDVPNLNKSLQGLYDLIGCDLVQLVELDRGIVMACDEEAKCRKITGAFTFYGTDLRELHSRLENGMYGQNHIQDAEADSACRYRISGVLESLPSARRTRRKNDSALSAESRRQPCRSIIPRRLASRLQARGFGGMMGKKELKHPPYAAMFLCPCRYSRK